MFFYCLMYYIDKLIKFIYLYEYFWFRMNVMSFYNTCKFFIFFKI